MGLLQHVHHMSHAEASISLTCVGLDHVEGAWPKYNQLEGHSVFNFGFLESVPRPTGFFRMCCIKT